MAEVMYDLLDGAQVSPLVPQIRDLYAEVYAEPPYNEGPQHVARFEQHLTEEVDRQGFTLVRAVASGELVGVAYGWTMPAGRWFGSATSEPPAELRDVPKFAVMEWIVRKAHRGTGIGRQLLGLLLAGRPEPWAVLASNPAAPARDIYERLGWQQYGTSKPDMLPEMDVLATRLLHRENELG